EVSQSGTRHDFRRNILADGEQSARFLWVLTERGLAAANPHPRSAVESHRLATRRRDAEHNNAAIRVINDARLDAWVGHKAGSEPRQQILIAFRLLGVGIEVGANDGVGRVV